MGFVEDDGRQRGTVHVGNAHSCRSARKRAKAPSRRATGRSGCLARERTSAPCLSRSPSRRSSSGTCWRSMSTLTASLPEERINVANAGPRHVLRVSSDHDKILCQSRGGDQSINTRNAIRDSKVSPSFGNCPIHADDAIPILLDDSVQPFVERHGRRRVAPADLLHTAPKLADRQDTQKQLAGFAFSEPTDDMGICSITFSKFRYHVCVDQVVHNSIRRGPERSRSKSMSSPTSGMASRCSMNASGDLDMNHLMCAIPLSDNSHVPRGESLRR